MPPFMTRRGAVRRTTALVALALLSGLVGTATVDTSAPTPAAAADAFNPRNYDTSKVMDAIVNPKPDLVTIAFHRGAHALIDGRYRNIPENSKQALEVAAKEGFEMVEIDVKSTSDHVSVLSHDTRWGRETTYNPPGVNAGTFTPFIDDGKSALNDSRNPFVDQTTWDQIKSFKLRNSIDFTASNETVLSLQQALDYMTANRIAMVLSLDIRDQNIAADAWRVISSNRDYLGRPYADSTLFKIPAKAFATPADFKRTFGSNYQSVWYQPVYNTSDLAPDTFGSEQGVLNHFRALRADTTIKVAATEVQMKETGGILTPLLNEAKKKPNGQPAAASVFSTYVDYYDDAKDPDHRDPQLFKTTAYCCQRLTDFLFNKNKEYPNLPSDTRDQRGSIEWVKGMGFASVTTDQAPNFNESLNRDGIRNISYMQASTGTPGDPLPPATPGRTGIRSPDPSVIKRNNQYLSVEMQNGAIVGRVASSLSGLQNVTPFRIWSDASYKEVWAPDIVYLDGRFYIYFAAGAGAAHRMHVISSTSFSASGWSSPTRMALPDDKWAIDGIPFNWKGQRWFVWSGWKGDTDGQQVLYVAQMSSPTTTTGGRTIISEPAETWEKVGGNPLVNEGPQPVMDPNGQLHIVYSARHSWQADYCLADLRLKQFGSLTYVWDWYKSNGCLFGSDGGSMQKDWYPTKYTNGPGHHSWVLPDGDISQSPTAAYPTTHSFAYHGVPKGMNYSWDNRVVYNGAYTWYNNINYTRANVPGDVTTKGYSPMFFEDPAFTPNPPPVGPSPASSRTSIQKADPSVIRQGGTYISVEAGPASVRGRIEVRQASSLAGIDKATVTTIWEDTNNLGEVWAPEIIFTGGRYYIYFSAGQGNNHRMYVISSSQVTRDYSTAKQIYTGDRWAVDGTSFVFEGKRYFVYSGRAGTINDEQNLYIAPMSSPTDVNTIGIPIISQPRESWERVSGGNGYPYINEAPEPIVDPNGQLHIVYSANGSWSDQYCMADLRLKKGGSPLAVFDYYKSNGCLFGSNPNTMMSGWDPTLQVNGPGHHSFVLVDGDVATSPPAGPKFPMMYHAVDKGTPYTWENRFWYTGTFTWWGNTTYTRGPGNGDTSNTGWGLKFFEGDGPA